MTEYLIKLNNYINPELRDKLINQTLENKICTCGHLDLEHEFGTCYGLDDIGSIWKACNCKRLVIQNLSIEIYHYETKN